MKKGFVLSIIICILPLLLLVSGCGKETYESQIPIPETTLPGETSAGDYSVAGIAETPDEIIVPSGENITDIEDETASPVPVEPSEEAVDDQKNDTSDEGEDAEADIDLSEEAGEPLTEDVDGNDISQHAELPHELNYSDDIDTIIASMTLHEKICQMIIVTPSVLASASKVTSADSCYLALQNYPVGGLILDKSNIVNADQLAGYISGVQSYMTIPMIVTLDEEGGRVTRLMGTVGTTPIGPMYSYHELGTEVAAFNAMTIGNDIRRFGFNMDLAPVADVWSNPDNTVIGDRAYSTDFEEASDLVSAAVSGFHMSGVACCIKHFPGHGDTSADSHYGSVYVYKTLDEMRAAEFKPFVSGINAGADAVMIGHLIVADQGNIPALFSYPLLTGVLRNELGFNGVIISDSLQMKAMTDHYGAGEIPVMAVAAGCDIILMPTDLEVTVSSLEAAVENGVISEERINESVRRILILKKKYI